MTALHYLIFLYSKAFIDLKEHLAREVMPRFVSGGQKMLETEWVLGKKAAYREIEIWITDRLLAIEKAESDYETMNYNRSLSEVMEDWRKEK